MVAPLLWKTLITVLSGNKELGQTAFTSSWPTRAATVSKIHVQESCDNKLLPFHNNMKETNQYKSATLQPFNVLNESIVLCVNLVKSFYATDECNVNELNLFSEFILRVFSEFILRVPQGK